MESLISISDGVRQGEKSDQDAMALSVIVPTRNEAGNVKNLLSSLEAALDHMPAEVIFVDDSTDDTPRVVQSAVANFPTLHVRLIHRPPEQRTGGLGGAVMLGLQLARAEYACVMDGDLQHPPAMVPVLLRTAQEKNADIVIATRRTKESEVVGLNRARNLISRSLDLLARVFFPKELRGVSDPLTGFFLVRVAALDLSSLRPKGFKILLEILVRHPDLRKAEVPFHFGERLAGQSKASASEVWRYFNLLWTLRFGGGFTRFLGFAAVGLSGILVNSLALYAFTDRLHIFYLYSVALATAVSTLWNFSLTEGWVYRSERTTGGILRRLGLFSVMNALALVLRTPLVYLLTDILGVYYVLSNLISLTLLTILRFTLADNIIWRRSRIRLTGAPTISGEWSRSMKNVHSYDIHGIVSVISEGILPELEPFRVSREISEPTIRVRLGTPPTESPSGAANSHFLNYHEIFGRLGFEVGIDFDDQVNIIASPLLGLSPHVLYTNVVEPILRWTFVKKGYALVHGATIAFGNDAYVITARTDTGKTTTLLKILSHQRRGNDRAAFLSDDMSIVSPDGVVMTYPKPMTISHHTLRAVNSDTLNIREKLVLPFQSRVHSRSGRKVAFLISKTKMPAATINMWVQMLVPPPKYTVQKLVPGVKVARRASLAGMFIIERGDNGIASMQNAEAVEVLLKNCEDAYGFPPYDDLKEFLYCSNGDDLREAEQAIIRQAFGGLPATLIRSDHMDWWCRIPAFVDEQVARDCTCEIPNPGFVYQREGA